MAENLWKVRETKGLTPSQLAARAGIALALLLEYENGKLLSTDDQIRLARALYVDTSEIRLRSDPRPPRYAGSRFEESGAEGAPRSEPGERSERPRYESSDRPRYEGSDRPAPSRYDANAPSRFDSDRPAPSRYDSDRPAPSRYDSDRPRYEGSERPRYDAGAPRYGDRPRYEGGQSRYGSGTGGSNYNDRPRYNSDRPRYEGGGERRSYSPGGPDNREPRSDFRQPFERRPRIQRGIPKPPPPVKPNQMAHLLKIAKHVGLSEEQLLDEVGKPLEDLNVREARYWLTQLDMRAKELPKRKAPVGYRANRANLPEAVDEYELKYLTNAQTDEAALTVKLFNGDTVTGTLIGFSTYSLTLKVGSKERTLQKLAVAYYERAAGGAE